MAWIGFKTLSMSHAEQAYPLGCSTKPSSYYDFESTSFPPITDIPIKSNEDYMLVRRLGAGKFSDVFESVDLHLEQRLRAGNKKQAAYNDNISIDPQTLVVLKCLKPVAERKIKRELLVLQHASKLPNLARLLALVIPPDYQDSSKKYHLQEMPALVLEHAGVDSQWFCHPKAKDEQYLTDEQIQYFLYHLLVALDQLHAAGIMHRDVKPRNVLIDMTDMSLMLIDLGLADFFMPNTQYNVRVASRHYKAPELLLGNENYDYAIDLWGVGCILAGLLFRREPFFRGKDNMDQLGTIIAVLGTADLHSYVAKAKIAMKPEIRKVIAKYTLRGGKKKEWRQIVDESTGSSIPHTPSAQGLDLLSKLIVYDHTARLTAKQAMQHSYFDPVRDRVERQIREKLRKLNERKP